MNDILKINFITKAINVHGNEKYNYDEIDYKNNRTKIKIFCNKHKLSFYQIPSDHLTASGCKQCGIEARIEKRKLPYEQFIDRSNKIHNNHYDYSLVKYDSISNKVKIICHIYGECEQRAEDHMKGHQCCKCQIRETIAVKKPIIKNKSSGKKMSREEFIEKAIIVHGIGRYNYDLVQYINSSTKVKIKCERCDKIIEQIPSSHLDKKGCIDCARKEQSKKRTMTQEQFLEKAKQVFGEKYDYSLTVYKSANEYIIIICKKHGQYKCTAGSHLANHECRKCTTEYNSIKRALEKDEFIKRAFKLYKNEYNYDLVEFANMHDKIQIKCDTHGIFIKTVKKHLENQGCPKCARKNFSAKSINWLEYVAKTKNITIQHAMNTGEYNLPNTNLKVDGFCEETHTVYEFHGSLWHGDIRLYKPQNTNPVNKRTFGDLYIKTLERQMQIQKLEFNLIIMWEYDWDQFCKLNNATMK